VNSFKTTALQELTDQQVRFAPPARQLQQLARAEKLLTEIDQNKVYPYQYVCFRITEFRPDSYADVVITGQDLEHDLCRMIEKLVESMPAVPVEELAEPVVTMDQMSKQLNVSTKTISRWRSRGLVGRRVVCNGRSQVGFVRSVVDHFLKANQERVDKGSRFSQLTEEEKEEILLGPGGCRASAAAR